MSTIGIAITSANAALAIASYFELIDTVSSDVSKLLHQSFKSARMNLELAQTSDNLSQREEYVKEARNKFVEAIAVEKDENLVSAYAGLAMCQLFLGDEINMQLTLGKIGTLQLSRAAILKALATGSFKESFIPIPTPVLGYGAKLVRVVVFDNYKQQAISEVEKMHEELVVVNKNKLKC